MPSCLSLASVVGHDANPASYMPTKAARFANDVVVADSLPAHKPLAACNAAEAGGARPIFLPSCSPDFNPVESAFAKLKALLPKAAARTVSELWDMIATLSTFTAWECTTYSIAAKCNAT